MADRWGNAGNALAGIAALVQGLSKLRDPKREEREKLMERMQADPELAQKYRDNPQMLQMLEQQYGGPRFLKGLGKQADFGKYLQQMPMSPEAVELQKVRTAQGREGMNAAANAVTPFGNFDTTESEKVTLENYRKKILGAPTRADVKEQATRQKGLEQGVTINDQNIESNKLSIQDKQQEMAEQAALTETRNGLLKAFPKPKELYQAYKTGRLNSLQVRAALSDDALSKFISSEAAKDENALQRQHSAWLATQREKFDVNEYMAQQTAIAATQLVKRFPQLNYNAVHAVKSNPALEQQLRAMPNAPADPALASQWKVVKDIDTALENESKTEQQERFRKWYSSSVAHVFTGKKGKRISDEAATGINTAAAMQGFDFSVEVHDPWGPGGKQYIARTTDPAVAALLKGQGVKVEMPQAQEASDDDKAQRYEILKKRYPKETPAQIAARVNKGER